ncbi:MAG: hypothetical protein HZB71_14630 [Betaproteobacteria bacterium]|nr:hypothetical protein [Betaproteobacteria bacterium]
MHTFERPDFVSAEPAIGEPWSALHSEYDEGVRYVYRYGAHELTLFWRGPTAAEVRGLQQAPVEVGLFTHGPAAFLLYRIQNVCEWSDAAFNLHLLPEGERAVPSEPAGERARLKLTLVDADSGLILARHIVSLDKVVTQALRHVMQEQAAGAFNRLLYDAAVQEVHGRYADTDALVQVAEVVEPCLG